MRHRNLHRSYGVGDQPNRQLAHSSHSANLPGISRRRLLLRPVPGRLFAHELVCRASALTGFRGRIFRRKLLRNSKPEVEIKITIAIDKTRLISGIHLFTTRGLFRWVGALIPGAFEGPPPVEGGEKDAGVAASRPERTRPLGCCVGDPNEFRLELRRIARAGFHRQLNRQPERAAGYVNVMHSGWHAGKDLPE